MSSTLLSVELTLFQQPNVGIRMPTLPYHWESVPSSSFPGFCFFFFFWYRRVRNRRQTSSTCRYAFCPQDPGSLGLSLDTTIIPRGCYIAFYVVNLPALAFCSYGVVAFLIQRWQIPTSSAGSTNGCNTRSLTHDDTLMNEAELSSGFFWFRGTY